MPDVVRCEVLVCRQNGHPAGDGDDAMLERRKVYHEMSAH